MDPGDDSSFSGCEPERGFEYTPLSLVGGVHVLVAVSLCWIIVALHRVPCWRRTAHSDDQLGLSPSHPPRADPIPLSLLLFFLVNKVDDTE